MLIWEGHPLHHAGGLLVLRGGGRQREAEKFRNLVNLQVTGLHKNQSSRPALSLMAGKELCQAALKLFSSMGRDMSYGDV